MRKNPPSFVIEEEFFFLIFRSNKPITRDNKQKNKSEHE